MDAWLKRNFWVVVVALGAIATYFFAAGLTQLVASKYLPLDPGSLAARASVRILGAPPSTVPARSLNAKVVLESNPFDSVTGPIRDVPKIAAAPETTDVGPGGERMFSPCSGGSKLEITVVDPLHPSKSFAVVSSGEGSASKPLVREGSTASGREVAVIVREKVYFKEGTSYCFVGMFQPPQAAPVHGIAPTQPEPSYVEPPRPLGGPGGVPEEYRRGIQKIDETNYNIDRNIVDKIIENQAELMKTARIVPEQENGKVVGIRLLNIRPDTLLGVLGLRAGDMLKSINGFDMTSPEKALEAYAKLRTAPQIQVGVVRGGKPTNIEFNIK